VQVEGDGCAKVQFIEASDWRAGRTPRIRLKLDCN
jgi:hypothetical protein